jgi:hypothetical protein
MTPSVRRIAVPLLLVLVAVVASCGRQSGPASRLTGIPQEQALALGEKTAAPADNPSTPVNGPADKRVVEPAGAIPAGISFSLSLSPGSVVAGSTAQGTITLSSPIVKGSGQIKLSSSSSAATVPGSANVHRGQTTATFNVSTFAVLASTDVVITATSGSSTSSATLHITPATAALASLALSPSSLVGGASATGTVTLAQPAVAGGVVVGLSTDNGSVTSIASSVTVPEGTTSATFSIGTSTVLAATNVVITASLNGGTKTATLTVNPPPAPAALASLACSPASLQGGASAQGTVTLTAAAVADVVVGLASDNTAAGVPASVTVLAGRRSATFPISTSVVASVQNVTLTASLNGGTKIAALTVNPIPPAALASLAVSPTSLLGGASAQGTVTLTAAAVADVVVGLASDNAAASPAASVTVLAGRTSANFAVPTSLVSSVQKAVITASLNGGTKTATLTIDPVVLASLSVSPASLQGGASAQGTVTLAAAAPPGGVTVALASDKAAAGVPASLIVNAGASSANFAISTSAVVSLQNATISASLNGVTKTAGLAINPPPVSTDPCASLQGLGGAANIVLADVPQFRVDRLRVELTGDVAAGTINAMGSCSSLQSPPPSISWISGTGSLRFSGTNTQVTVNGLPLAFGPLLTVPGENGVLLATDAAGNVLEIIWPALAGLPPGAPILRLQLAAYSAAVHQGSSLDCDLTFVARAPDGTTATFTAHGANMIVPTLR